MSRRPTPSRSASSVRPASRGGRIASGAGSSAAGAGRTAGRDRVTAPTEGRGVRHGVARVLSKSGLCSRSEAARWVQDGRVRVDGRVVIDPEYPVVQGRSRVTVDGQPLDKPQHRYLLLNKPRGLVTTTQDEKGRETVYRCFDGAGLPWIAPVGRLDKASEGLLLFSSDPQWAAAITSHEGGVTKTYHVQVDAVVDSLQLQQMAAGVEHDGVCLKAVSVSVLRRGEKSCWLKVVLDEGRNRHIRRLMEAHGLSVQRLVRVAIGSLALGAVGKGQWRELDEAEVRALVAGGEPRSSG